MQVLAPSAITSASNGSALPSMTYLLTYLLTYLRTYLLTYLPTYLRTYVRTYQRLERLGSALDERTQRPISHL